MSITIINDEVLIMQSCGDHDCATFLASHHWPN
jgi:hypothetical protein